METCELMEDKALNSQEGATEMVVLLEEKMFLRYLDSDARNHLTSDTSQFFELGFAVGRTVQNGDGNGRDRGTSHFPI
jgi:hypothetical protein